MAIQTGKSSSMNVKVNIDNTAFYNDLKKSSAMAMATGKEISEILSSALTLKNATSATANLNKYLSSVRHAAEATKKTNIEINHLTKSLGNVGCEFNKAAHESKAFNDSISRMIELSKAYNCLPSISSCIPTKMQPNTDLQDTFATVTSAVVTANKLTAEYTMLAGTIAILATFFKNMGLEVLTAQTIMIGLANVAKGLFTKLGGWITLAGVAVTGLYHLITAETEAEGITRQYSDAVRGMKGSAGEAAAAIADLENSISSMSTAQAQKTFRELESQCKELFNSLETYTFREKFSSFGLRLEGIQVDVNPLRKLTEQYERGTLSAQKFQDAIYRAKIGRIISATTRDTMIEEINTIEYLRTKIDLLTRHTSLTSNTFKELGDSIKTAFTADAIDANINILQTNMNKIKQSAAGGIVVPILINTVEKSGLIDQLRNGMKKFIPVKENKEPIKVPEKLVSVNSGSGINSTAQHQKNAIKEINDEISRLTSTEKKYAELKLDQKIADYKKLAIPAELLSALREATASAELKKSLDEASNSLHDFEKSYQNAFNSTSAATASIQSEMDKLRAAAKVSFDQSKLSAQEYEETLQKIADLEAKRTEEITANTDSDVSAIFKDYATDAATTIKNIEAVISNGLSNMENALVDFVIRGKLEFSNLVNSIIVDLARLAVRQAILAPLVEMVGGLFSPSSNSTIWADITTSWLPNLFKFSTGNAFSASPGLSAHRNSVVTSPTLFAFAKGGIPNIGLMGEKAGSPGEAIMPLTRTSTGDLGVQVDIGNTQRSGDVYYQISLPSIHVEYSSQEGASPEMDGHKMAESLGTQLRKELVSFVRQELLTQSRPGGMLNAGIGA